MRPIIAIFLKGFFLNEDASFATVNVLFLIKAYLVPISSYLSGAFISSLALDTKNLKA